jgi:hypothetical protein
MWRAGFTNLTKSTFTATVVVAICIYLSGCAGPGGELKENKPPTVWLSGAPPEGTVDSYTIEMFWGGWDPDGEIAYYEFCITVNDGGTFDPADTVGPDAWGPVFSNDSTFSLTADVLVDTNATNTVTDFMRSHTFFIRAVDMEGLASRAPAYRSFTAHTLSPDVLVKVPRRVGLNAAEVPPITTFRWVATDYVHDRSAPQEPDSVSWLLESLVRHNDDFDETIDYIRRLPVDDPLWSDWAWYGAPEDSGKFWTTPAQDMGYYVFAIRAKDEAGAITPVFDEKRNVRRILVSDKRTGPVLTVRNEFLGKVQTAVCNTPLTILDLPAGLPVEFAWTADASSYGGTMVGYRYGWDITDLNDDDQWETDFTPFQPHDTDELATAKTNPPRTFAFGTHVFTIEVLDNSGLCARAEVKLNVVEFTMERDLLVVDDYHESDWGGWYHAYGKGLEPNDKEHDEFWTEALENVRGFNPVSDMIDVAYATGVIIPLTKLAQYKSIIWSVKAHRNLQPAHFPAVRELIKFRPKGVVIASGKQQPNLLTMFLASGGHLLYCGYHPMSMSIALPSGALRGMRYPTIFKYDLDQFDYSQRDAPSTEMVRDPPGDQSFAYLDMCLETMDYAVSSVRARRSERYHCPVHHDRRLPNSNEGSVEYLRTVSMRAAIPLDPNFPRLELRPETALPGKAHDPGVKGPDVEVYNPQYFFDNCISVDGSRDCFEPIYGLECFDTSEPTYAQPIAFWTSKYADVQATAPGAVMARSAVFGFPPVLINPDQAQAAIERIVFDEWQLPRMP